MKSKLVRMAMLVWACATTNGVLASVQTFDTPTTSTAQTAAIYGLTSSGTVADAQVSGGRLHLECQESVCGSISAPSRGTARSRST